MTFLTILASIINGDFKYKAILVLIDFPIDYYSYYAELVIKFKQYYCN